MVDLKDFFLAAEFSSACPKDLGSWVERAKVRAKRTVEAVRLIDQLRTSWWQHDPGKSGPYVFFVRDYRVSGRGQVPEWCDAFFAREVINNLARAEQGVGNHYSGSSEEPNPVPLGDMCDIRREPCTECDHDAIVIGLHWQSFDSPYGDTWVLQLMRLCPNCGLVDRFASCDGEYRMTSRLKPPKEQ